MITMIIIMSLSKNILVIFLFVFHLSRTPPALWDLGGSFSSKNAKAEGTALGPQPETHQGTWPESKRLFGKSSKASPAPQGKPVLPRGSNHRSYPEQRLRQLEPLSEATAR